MQASENLIYSLIARMENGFGRLEEGQRQNRMASEERTKALHKRIDKVEAKLERHQEAKASKINYWKVASHLLGNWHTYLTIVLVIVGLMLGKNAETIREWVGVIKQ